MNSLFDYYSALNKTQKKLTILLGVLLLVGVSFLAMQRGKAVQFGSDFYTYYSTAEHFSEGEALYQNKDSGALYIYPPFAAWLFQLLLLVSQGTAISLMVVFNFLLTMLNLYLLFQIVQKLSGQKMALAVVLLSLLFAISDTWNNINFSQINTFVFFLILQGLHLYLEGKKKTAMVLWTFGAWIKVLPVYFILWGLLRDFKWKSLLSVAMVSVLCIALPLIARGIETGTNDLITFFNDVLLANTKGVNIIWRNHSLPAGLTRLLYDRELLEFKDAAWGNHVVAVTPTIVKVITFSLYGLLIGMSFFNGKSNIKISTLELAIIFLILHLSSGITWRGHLLTGLLFFLPLAEGLLKNRNWMNISLGLLVLFSFFVAPTFLSREFREMAYENNLIVGTLLLVFVYYLFRYFKLHYSSTR